MSEQCAGSPQQVPLDVVLVELLALFVRQPRRITFSIHSDKTSINALLRLLRLLGAAEIVTALPR
jgi:hypothetical protein